MGGVIKGCALASGSLALRFYTRDRKLAVRAYNKSSPVHSATSVLTNATGSRPEWLPVHVALGTSPGIVMVNISSLPANASPLAVRYAWGGTDPKVRLPGPSGDDVSCCEGDAVAEPCLPGQCPLMAEEPKAPFGGLPADPFLAKIVNGACVCPEPQKCSDAIEVLEQFV